MSHACCPGDGQDPGAEPSASAESISQRTRLSTSAASTGAHPKDSPGSLCRGARTWCWQGCGSTEPQRSPAHEPGALGIPLGSAAPPWDGADPEEGELEIADV